MVRTTRRFVYGLTALALLATSIEPSYSNGLADRGREGAVFTGPAAMFGLRVPFGGEARRSVQPILSFSVGSSWRAVPGSLELGDYRFIRNAEVGTTLRGNPVLTLGSLNLRPDRLRASADEGNAGEGGFCTRNFGVCLGVGFVGVFLLVGAFGN
jgi:hypothetical protein